MEAAVASESPAIPPADDPWVKITDFHAGQGWRHSSRNAERARWCCEQLEEGQVLFFETIPFDFPEADQQFLLGRRQSGARVHKNISYRPKQDVLRGNASEQKEDTERLHRIMRHYSEEVTRFLTRVLTPYSKHWSLDFASFRPEEEMGRKLALHKRNDLLHVDAFPSRPTRGNRILRCFTNINPKQPRVWLTTERFGELARQFAREAGLEQIAAHADGNGNGNGSVLTSIKRLFGLKTANRSAYDKFMLRFHDYLKENTRFQETCRKIRIAFPPKATWMCFTDSVPHAVLSGQYALEQTFIIPVSALVRPEKSPLRVLEKIAGRPLAPVVVQAA